MSVVKDLTKEFWVTRDQPEVFGGSSPTWVKYKGSDIPNRLADSDSPEEEPNTQTMNDSRESHASTGMSFTQTILEDDEDSAVFDEFDGAALKNENLWIKRVAAQDGVDTEIIGGQMGLMVAMGKVRFNDEGNRAFNVQLTGIGVGAGDLITPDTSGS